MKKALTLEDFVRESNAIEGITTTTKSQIGATRIFICQKVICMSDIAALAELLQPAKLKKPLLRNQEGMNVRVGDYYAPKGGPRVEQRLLQLLDKIAMKEVDSYEAHVEYESIHPLNDCNGRTGRALWLWMRINEIGGFPQLSFLHSFYYQALDHSQGRKVC